MHKVVVVLVGLFIAACLVVAQGVKRVEDITSGTKVVTLLNADSTVAMTAGMSKYRITFPRNLNDLDDQGSMFDAIRGMYLVDTFIATTACSGCNAVNRAYITTYAGGAWENVAIATDTCTSFPCTVKVWYASNWFEYDEGGDTSGSGIWLPSTAAVQRALMYDHLWFDYIVVDSAGTGDTLIGAIKYWFRGVEFE